MDKTAILRWLHSIDETDEAAIEDILQYCAINPDALSYYLERSKEALHKPEEIADDRHYCRKCLNLRNGYCIKQRFRPVDDIPRRCEDFRVEPLQKWPQTFEQQLSILKWNLCSDNYAAILTGGNRSV